MSHVVHVDACFANDTYYAESSFWINNGTLLAENVEELAASIEAVVKGVNAQDILPKLQNIHTATD